MSLASSPEGPEEAPRERPFLSLAGDTLALLALAIPFAAAPLDYPYHYVRGGWYVSSEATALLAGLLAVAWALADRLYAALARRPLAPVAPSARRLLLALGAGYAAYVAWAAFENGRAVWPEKAWSEWFLILASGLAAYAVYRFSGREGLFLPVLAAVLAGPVVVSFVGLEQYMALHDWSTREITRIWSTTGNANTLSCYLAPALPLAIVAAYACDPRWRIVPWLASVLVATGILLSYTRGGWYSVALAVLVLGLILDRRILVAALAYVVVASLVFPGVVTRATSAFAPEESLSFEQRLQLWWTAYYMWLDEPLLGVGTGSYSTLIPVYVREHPEIDRGLRNREPHNTYLKTLAEQGLVGFALVFGTLALGWWASIRAFRRSRAGPRRALLAGVVCAVLAAALHSGTNSLLHDFRSALGFWTVAGLGLRLLATPDDAGVL